MGTELATRTESASYMCLECGHQGVGVIEVEERTDASWSDNVCDECGNSILDWEER